MSTGAQLAQQLQQELQNELTTSNQLLRLISLELQQIKQFTGPGGEFEANIKQNASLMSTLASIQQVDIENLPPLTRTHIDLGNNVNQNLSYEQHDTFRESSNMDDSQ
ncbi:uncharacterized protein LOC126373639 [Pectinophora gossypiella]|uniref:uncharacterized protein LOC126373639 n=1 Tax=Pectinophora gossypiella TaxID=13191 RepID=UPI00214E14CD|nr:uncharacterized protein LOC126373639 [Pectinophora gossypiella]